MDVLIIGGGGREHALAWKLNQSPAVERLYCAPGNAGTALIGENVSIGAEEIDRLIKWITQNEIDVTVVGPEAPLVQGIVDEFHRAGLHEAGLKIFGPSKGAAKIEASKVFAKEFMLRHKIPTARFQSFGESSEASEFIRSNKWAKVVKADGLAQGKGVVVTSSEQEAVEAVDTIVDRFPVASERILVEQRLWGEEVSFMVFTDGKSVVPMLPAQDFKRIHDGDRGPNSGGMGAHAPVPIVTAAIQERIIREIILPTIKGLNCEGRHFKGVLYAGLMITAEGPKVLEFNVRFGDPELQAVLPLMKSDLTEVLLAVIEERLDSVQLEWLDGSAVCVVLASEGYPGNYEIGKEIRGFGGFLDRDDMQLFHAGTRRQEHKIVTNGGRVLGITGVGSSLSEAAEIAYNACEKIAFEGMYYRRDIGRKDVDR